MKYNSTRTRFCGTAATCLIIGAAFAAGSAPVLAQSAPPPMCDGRPATIVGQPGTTTVFGTSGDDIIISNGAKRVRAGDGADVVCMVGGNTLVETEDTLFGTPDRDVVIGTGGDDFVVSGARPGSDGSGEAILAAENDDDIRLGSGSSTIRLYGIPTGKLVGGDGDDVLLLRSRSESDWNFDLPAGDFTAGALSGRVVGIETFEFGDTSWPALTFTGTDRAETVYLAGNNPPADSPVSIDLGGGADTIALNARKAAEVDGGTGRDQLIYSLRIQDKRVDHVKAVFDDGDLTISERPGGPLLSFADATISGVTTLDVTGDANANVVRISDVCIARIDGNRGADIIASEPEEVTCGALSSQVGLRAKGGPGADRLIGGAGADSLLGGSGHDFADGSRGKDFCRAEVRQSC